MTILPTNGRKEQICLCVRGALTANFINGILYAVGGVDKSETLTSTLAYDPRNNTWTEKAPMPTAREHLTSATINGKLYVIGGRTAGMSTNVDANEVYDPANNKWTILQPMLSKRGGLASATAVNETIYVFGGEQPSGTFNNNEKYDPDTKKWTSSGTNANCTTWIIGSSELMMVKYMSLVVT